MTNDRLIDKLRKIKAHAESAAAIGSQAEAEAFAAMFQQLLQRHKIEATDIELEQEEKDEPVNEHLVDWQELGYGRRISWVEDLAATVCKAYFCRFLVTKGTARITLIGRKTDMEIAEYILVTLARTAERLVRIEYRKYKAANPDAHTKGFQVSFMAAFVSRLRERFSAERRAATVESMALVRVNRAEAAVKLYVQNRYPTTASSIGQSKLGNRAGAERGRAVADGVNLGANAIGGVAQKRIS